MLLIPEKLKSQQNSVNRYVDRFSSQADRSSADSGGEILMRCMGARARGGYMEAAM